jgi:hypothetical protein
MPPKQTTPGNGHQSHHEDRMPPNRDGGTRDEDGGKEGKQKGGMVGNMNDSHGSLVLSPMRFGGQVRLLLKQYFWDHDQPV